MPMYCEVGSPTTVLSDDEFKAAFIGALELLGERKNVCLIPPDYTRYHSRAGDLSQWSYEHYGGDGGGVKDVMPALGTHAPVSEEQRLSMFGDMPAEIFREHNWRTDVVTIGTVPAEMVAAASDGRVNEPWPAQLNKLVWEGDHDLILSIGQCVPHEVLGMANYNKNMFVGVGGAEAINFSHFIGAVYGMERMMGRGDNPLRQIFNYASDKYLSDKPVVYALTVIGRDEATGNLVPRGLFVGDDVECFTKACALSIEVNFTMLEEALPKVVVFLEEDEFHSTWLGNKALYRTRMAIADGGDLVVLAPGVKEFGEDKRIDELIRKYGYRTSPEILAFVEENRDLMKNLSAAAHLIHGSSEGRFNVTYAPGHLTREEVEGVGYQYADYAETIARYDPAVLVDGWNTLADGEKIYYVSNPAIGLWAARERFESSG